ncbi:MAG: hypothetical protein J4215_00890 [Candidatus Diapherotrites archaeon]|uniref:Uncharacterized protein n=1 Tax=Candidatus Iainarchaeum sp. TaxID=3101447 RepID=A0A8T4L6E4_9ARCH|nr:hypothetical protein [Candidatus Diapherotrites archaeon]
MVSNRLTGFLNPVLLIFSLAGLLLAVVGFLFSVFLVMIAGAMLLLMFLSLGLLLSSQKRFFSRWKKTESVSEKPFSNYLTVSLELEVAVLMLAAMLLLWWRFFLPAFG